MKPITVLLSATLLVSAFLSATAGATERFMHVDRTTTTCKGMRDKPVECLRISIDDKEGWFGWEYGIKGFTYKKGTYYLLKVDEVVNPNAPADYPNIEYHLIKILATN